MANRHTRHTPELAGDDQSELERWLRRSKTSPALALRAGSYWSAPPVVGTRPWPRDSAPSGRPSASGASALSAKAWKAY